MGIIMRNNVAYSGNGGSETVELSMAEYEAREATGAIDSDTWYLIYDATDSYNAKKVVYDNAESGMTARTVQGAIDELNSNLDGIGGVDLIHVFTGANDLNGRVTVDLSKYKLFLMVLNNLGDKYNIDLGTQSMLLPVLPPTSSFTLSKTVSGMTFSCSLSGSNISAMTFSCSNATQSALYGIK